MRKTLSETKGSFFYSDYVVKKVLSSPSKRQSSTSSPKSSLSQHESPQDGRKVPQVFLNIHLKGRIFRKILSKLICFDLSKQNFQTK